MKANNIVTELKRIALDNGGVLQPEKVVEEARPKTSPLHSNFEWDDSLAGQRYRIWQARQLIRVTVETIDGSDETMDVFVSLSPDRKNESGGYRILTEVLTNKERREQMLTDALNELETFRQRYERLKELSIVFKAIKKVRSKKD
jgi:hypothetical protein